VVMRFSSKAARRTALTGLAGLVLIAPGAARAIDAQAAKAKAPLRALIAPQSVLAGGELTIRARVANSARRSTKPRLVARLRKHRYASGGRVLFARKLGRVAAGDSRNFRVSLDVPESIAAGRYWLAVCVRVRGASGCKISGRRVEVSHPAPAPGGAPPPAPPQQDAAAPVRFDVMAFTEAVGETHDSAGDGVDALRDIGRREGFRVTHERSSTGAFTTSNLQRYQAVVFLNTAGDVLNDAEQAAFESYYRNGGGFLGIHSAIVTEPDWAFMTELLGTRAEGAAAPLDNATIKVADRVHDASKSLPEYWQHSDEYYNFEDNVRGFQHVLATVDETTYEGGTDGFDHPIAWCQDYEGGRAFYTGVGHTRQAFRSDTLRRHLAGAVQWTAGRSDPTYSDCGATVLSNFQQVKITAPPNLNEPIGFDQFPDGRIVQTTRDGRVRLHDPETGSVDVIAQIPVYTHSEDGLYGPAVDNNFASNRWVYLFYAPVEMEGIAENGLPYPDTTPPGNAPTIAEDVSTFQAWLGYFQLSRFKFVEAEGTEPAHLDLGTEQKIMKVEVDRGACCHVAGDIDFDKHNNLWLVTGDDTPAGSIGTNQFPPYNDMKTNETQTVTVANATGGTFTLAFDGQTTAPINFPLNNGDIESKLEALPNVTNVLVSGNQGGNRQVSFGGQYSREDVPLMTADATGLTSATTATVTVATTQEADWFVAPHNDARRGATNTNDLRGKLLRIKVNGDGSYSIPSGNLFPESMAKTRPEIYAMGFRNPFRVQVDSDGVAYVTDYSPDSRAPGQLRAAAGTGRVEIVREPSNYGWPMCYGPELPMYEWDFNMQQTFGEPFDCDDPDQGPANTSRWNTGLRHGPPITQPDIWYSYNDNADPPLGTPCLAYYDGSGGTCPQLFPELGTGGIGPHGADKYEYDQNNPSTTKFPPYYDNSIILGEFTRDWLREVRLDSRGGIHKINQTLNCGAFGSSANPFECDNPMDLQFGDDGNLYMLTYGDGFFVANPDAGLYRFEYVAGNQAPRAVMNATPTNGVAPLQVQFSSEGTIDPDVERGENDSIRFEWDFGVEDSTTDVSADPNPTFTYTANGVYTARLTVTDAAGNSDTKTIPITVGNTAPTVTITTPIDGDFFEWGDNIPYSVTVTDPQDATIDCNRVQVSFVLVHDQHGHGETTQTGCSGVLPTSPENASHGGYLAGGISVSYTDTGGAGATPPLTAEAQHVVQLRRQHVEYVQAAQGLQFSGVQAPETDPLGAGQAANQIDNGDWLLLNNRYSFDNMDKQITLRFANNQAAGTLRGLVDVRTDAVDGPVIATCELRSTGGNGTYTSQICPFTGAVTGSHRIYLTFRQAPGGPATGFGLLNWVEFSGPGLG
jgi:type 1 glutamine amidotransferase/PKD repeat protein